jgi:hypothetical protein
LAASLFDQQPLSMLHDPDEEIKLWVGGKTRSGSWAVAVIRPDKADPVIVLAFAQNADAMAEEPELEFSPAKQLLDGYLDSIR